MTGKVLSSSPAFNSLYLSPQTLEDLVVERYQRYQKVQETEQRAEMYRTEDAELVVVAYGASARIARSAVMQAREEGLKVGLYYSLLDWHHPDFTLDRNHPMRSHPHAVPGRCCQARHQPPAVYPCHRCHRSG